MRREVARGRAAGEEIVVGGEEDFGTQAGESEFVAKRQGIARKCDDGVFKRAREAGEFARVVNQRAGFEPAGFQGGNIDDFRHRAIRAENDLKTMVEREAVVMCGALTTPNLRRGIEEKKILPRAVKFERTGQSGQSGTDD